MRMGIVAGMALAVFGCNGSPGPLMPGNAVGKSDSQTTEDLQVKSFAKAVEFMAATATVEPVTVPSYPR
jgi:hypothetical protein